MYKILHVISDENIGGAGILLLNLLRHTDRSRFEPILALPKNSLLLPRARALGVRCFPLGAGADKTLSPSAIPALFRILQEERPHILHTNASLSARIAALPFRHMACIDTKHCCFPPTKQQMSALSRLAFRAFEALSGVYYIATARAVRENLLARGSAGNRVTVICGGSEMVPPLDETERDELRAQLGLPRNCFTVGLAARIENGKGHEHLLAAARLLANEKDIRFLIVGSGTLSARMKKAAEDLPNVIFTGFREDVGRVMNLFDLNLSCSYLSETSPLSLSEGMSLGIPIVVTDIGGNSDMAKGCGIVIPPRAPRALAHAILRLKADHTLYASLSKGAIRRHTAYSAEHMAKKTEALYFELIRQKKTQFEKRHFKF